MLHLLSSMLTCDPPGSHTVKLHPPPPPPPPLAPLPPVLLLLPPFEHPKKSPPSPLLCLMMTEPVQCGHGRTLALPPARGHCAAHWKHRSSVDELAPSPSAADGGLAKQCGHTLCVAPVATFVTVSAWKLQSGQRCVVEERSPLVGRK